MTAANSSKETKPKNHAREGFDRDAKDKELEKRISSLEGQLKNFRQKLLDIEEENKNLKKEFKNLSESKSDSQLVCLI